MHTMPNKHNTDRRHYIPKMSFKAQWERSYNLRFCRINFHKASLGAFDEREIKGLFAFWGWNADFQSCREIYLFCAKHGRLRMSQTGLSSLS